MEGLSLITTTIIIAVGFSIAVAFVDLVRRLLSVRQPKGRSIDAKWQRIDNLAADPFASDGIEAPPPAPAARRDSRQAAASEAYASQTWRSAPAGRIRPDLYLYESALPPKPPITARMPHPHVEYWQYANPSNYR
jgi:hypothetical protein